MDEQNSQRWNENLKRHPQYQASVASKPSAARLYLRYAILMVFGAIFLGVAVFFFTVSPTEAPAAFRTAWTAGSLLFIAIGIGILVHGLYRLITIGASRTESVPGLVLGKRTELRSNGSTGVASSSTTYFVTLELDDENRKELETKGRLYGELAEGDTGVAYIRDRYLLDYRRLAAM